MKRLGFLIFLFILSLSAAAFADLTGKWSCDDGGSYYLRQVGNSVYWFGEKSEHNPAWSNVFQGHVHGNSLSGTWADVPKGRIMGKGKLRLRILHHGNVLKATYKTGGFGGSRWTRVGYHPPAGPEPGLREDCVSFNPHRATVRRIHGRWKIVDGSHYLFDFGANQSEARKALRIIKHYRMNQSCFVGRPDPSFEYLMVSGRAPSGAVGYEDCVSFNPDTATVERIGGRWKIVDGSHWLFDFGPHEAEARAALAIIKRHGFNRSCFVGRPNPSFRYLRK